MYVASHFSPNRPILIIMNMVALFWCLPKHCICVDGPGAQDRYCLQIKRYPHLSIDMLACSVLSHEAAHYILSSLPEQHCSAVGRAALEF